MCLKANQTNVFSSIIFVQIFTLHNFCMFCLLATASKFQYQGLRNSCIKEAIFNTQGYLDILYVDMASIFSVWSMQSQTLYCNIFGFLLTFLQQQKILGPQRIDPPCPRLSANPAVKTGSWLRLYNIVQSRTSTLPVLTPMGWDRWRAS